ncbi:hypothetical protein Tco_1027842 [Tanacetum coccineum]
MLKNFNREDLEVLWNIVKDRFKKTEPENYMDNYLLPTLKTTFEHHIEDSIWKKQQGLTKVNKWKLFYSCGVYYMFNDVKLQVDYECEMAYELLRLVKRRLKEGYAKVAGTLVRQVSYDVVDAINISLFKFLNYVFLVSNLYNFMVV